MDPFFEMLAAENPIPMLHELRASDPVHFVEPPGFWLVTRHDDVKRLFHDPEHVTHNKHAWDRYALPPEGTLRRWYQQHSLFVVGREEHARVRRLVAAAFTPRAVRRMEQRIREVVEHTAAPLRGRHGEVLDLLGGFASVVPNTVISRITGVPPGDDEVRFRQIAQSVIQSMLPFTPEAVQLEGERGLRELTAWIRELVEKRRSHPEEDLVTDLVQAQDADDSLSEDDIVLLLIALLSAGSEATSHVAASVARVLVEESDAVQRLRSDRTLIRRSIDEILRYAFNQPAGTMRYALRDFELRGKQIRTGQMLMLSACGANHDPAVYENPEVLDLDRSVRDVMTFGNGPHYCLGANLAREEISSMLDALLDVVPPGSRLCNEAREYRDMGLHRAATNLPVQIGPAPKA